MASISTPSPSLSPEEPASNVPTPSSTFVSTFATGTLLENKKSESTYQTLKSLGVPPPGAPQKPIDNIANPPNAPQRRRRSHNVTPQDAAPARAAAAGKKPKYLGGYPITNYVDCITAQRNGIQPPRGYFKPNEWKVGAEHKAIERVKDLSEAPPPWYLPLKSESPSPVQRD